MPGVMSAIMLLAFDRNRNGEAVPAFQPVQIEEQEAALEQAEALSHHHAGFVIWRRDARPAVGEIGEPIVIFQRGVIGDFG